MIKEPMQKKKTDIILGFHSKRHKIFKTDSGRKKLKDIFLFSKKRNIVRDRAKNID